MTPRRLSRSLDTASPAAPVRIVHLGVGNFFRAHQASYTSAASDAVDWGIAAFTGRSAAVAEQLEGQDGLYTLCVQGPDGDEFQLISSLSAVHAAAEHQAWRSYFEDPELAIVTSTVTEAGYRRDSAGGLDLDDGEVAADLEILRRGAAEPLQTAPGKLLAGLMARQAADAGGLTFVPCDNVPDNADMLARVLRDGAAAVDDALLGWLDRHVTFVSTMVDRITPRATDADRERVADQTGIDDPALVVTEPFTEWVLSGEFVAGRPRWEDSGARFVDDVRPHELRKLWLLNGSHSLMAYGASVLGHHTVAEAIADDRVLGWVNDWWDVAGSYLELPQPEIADYREALLARYRNSRIKHQLAQIAGDGSQKLPIRAVPVLRAELDSDRLRPGATRTIAAWVCHLRGIGAPITDAQAEKLIALSTGDLHDTVEKVLNYLGIGNDEVTEHVRTQAEELSAMA